SAGEQSVNRCIDVAQNLFALGSLQEPLDAIIIAAVDLSGSIENMLFNTAKLNAKGLRSTDWLVGEGAGALVLQQTNAAHTQLDSYASID
ncbi:hypothetical protein, partial [Psychrobacter sp. GW64-MNA-CIBAN-0177]|uniref:hypothetical protein n=1 Tax=Psychrobacter sp. GW64-MNA-CIBAN-0177 TaxID=3140449 RepID=UPI00331AB3C9